MTLKHSLLYSTFFLFISLSIAQEVGTNALPGANKKQKKIIEAILGEDKKAPALTSIILDASKSRPNNGSLTYEWSFPENLIFNDDYEYDKSDSVIPYASGETKEPSYNGKTSIKKIITRNQYIELDLPDSPIEKEFIIVLKIQNHVGMNDIDSLSLVVTPSMNLISNELIESDGDQFLAIQGNKEEERVELTETVINKSYLTIQPINTQNLKPKEVELINSLIYNRILEKGYEKVLDPNRYISQEINLNKLYEKTKVVKDTIVTIIEPDTLFYTSKKPFVDRIKEFFKISSTGSDSLSDSLDLKQSQDLASSVDGVIVEPDSTILIAEMAPKKENQFYKFFKNVFKGNKETISTDSTKNIDSIVDDPASTENVASIASEPDSTILIAEMAPKKENQFYKFFKNVFKGNKKRIDADSSANNDSMNVNGLILTEKVEGQKIQTKEPIVLSDPSLDSIKADIIEVPIVYDSTFTIDTLTYNEVVDTTLYYDFNCKTDSCASENAMLEGVGRVLTWGLNEDSELEIRYFTVSDYFSKEAKYDWVVSKAMMDSTASDLIKYPQALATSLDGTLFIGVGNTQDVVALRKNQEAEVIIQDMVLEDELLNPAGLVNGTNDEIYFSDKNNNRILVKAGDTYRTLLNLNNNNNNGESEPPRHPSIIRVGPDGALYALYEKNGSVYKLSKREILTVLNPNTINSVDDIAINKSGEVFVLSSENKKIYKVINADMVTVFAGVDHSEKNKRVYRRSKNAKSLRFSGRSQDPALMNDFSANKVPFGNPVSFDFDINDNLYIADKKYGTIRKIDQMGMISTFAGPSEDLKEAYQIRVTQSNSFEVFISQPLKHKISRIYVDEVSPWVNEVKINHPKYILNKKGVYGLEPLLNDALSEALGKTLPSEKKSIRKRFKKQNKRLTGFAKRNPLFFGLALLLINQGVAASLENPPSLPPDFPFQ